jgi:hypothetical protein
LIYCYFIFFLRSPVALFMLRTMLADASHISAVLKNKLYFLRLIFTRDFLQLEFFFLSLASLLTLRDTDDGSKMSVDDWIPIPKIGLLQYL